MEQEEEFKKDKIFDNNFSETEIEINSQPLQIDGSFKEICFDEKIDQVMISDKLREVYECEELLKYNTKNSKGEFPVLSKQDINKVYYFIKNTYKDIPIIEIFSDMCDFYCIKPDKAYEALSVTFKTELINKLKERGYLKNIKSLF